MVIHVYVYTLHMYTLYTKQGLAVGLSCHNSDFSFKG